MRNLYSTSLSRGRVGEVLLSEAERNTYIGNVD